jgi:hypothetical protein
MAWIKIHFEKVILLAVALALLISAVLLIKRASGYSQTFEPVYRKVPENDKVREVDIDQVNQSLAALSTPVQWEHKGHLFAAARYVLKNGMLEEFKDLIVNNVPVEWFSKHNLDPLDPGILQADSDGDKFTNMEEYEGDSDPRDPNSTPPFVTKLRLEKIDRKPFRLLFNAYTPTTNGNSYQINTIDVKQPTLFLNDGEAIPNTRFKILSFEQKSRVNPATEAMEDVSELTIQNVDTGDKLVLPLGKIANSPDSIAYLRYLWDESSIQVKRDQEFKLPPDTETTYKVIDIPEAEILIENLKTGAKTTLRLEAR